MYLNQFFCQYIGLPLLKAIKGVIKNCPTNNVNKLHPNAAIHVYCACTLYTAQSLYLP